jgi:hypothetical protein
MKLLSIFKRNKPKRYNHEAEVKDKLVFAFEAEGHKYYRFPNELSLPFFRFAAAMSLLERLSSGISGGEMDKVLEVMEKALGKGLSAPKNASTVAACIHALRERQESVIHKDLLINIAAIWIVRDDETTTGEVNPKIHENKCQLFEKLAEKEGEHGFFISLAIERLHPLLSMSAQDFNDLWKHNTAQMSVLNNQMQFLSSHLDNGRQKSKMT